MPDTPTLRLVEDALTSVAKRASSLREKAVWLWPLGYERRRGEHGGGGMGISKPTEVAAGHDTWTCERGCTRHPRGGGLHSASPEWVIRNNVFVAGKKIIEASAQLALAEAALDQAAKAAGRGDTDPSGREEQLTKTATKDEVTKARQMKRWRDEERKKGVARGSY